MSSTVTINILTVESRALADSTILMTTFSDSQIYHSLTTDFKSSLYPLYDTSVEPLTLVELNKPELSSIAKVAISIYCPHQRVADYNKLICQEVALRHAHYDRHQPVASIWWLGSPLQQFSPEAITELCFRLSSHFSNQHEGSTRGMTVTPMELDKNNLALIKGLNFNAIQLNIDASIASGDRSLSKPKAALQLLADYKSFDLNCVIKLSEQTHQDFLERLLSLLENSHCTHIEVSSPESRPVSLQDKQVCQDQLASINKHFRDCGWRTCGNNNFFAPSHPLHQQTKVEATPWGYLAKQIPSRLGFGVAALSLNNGSYQYNTPSSEHYLALLAEKKSPVQKHFCLPTAKQPNYQIIQDLLCRHSIQSPEPKLHQQLASLIPCEWLRAETDKVMLSQEGIVNLSSICDRLFEPLQA